MVAFFNSRCKFAPEHGTYPRCFRSNHKKMGCTAATCTAATECTLWRHTQCILGNDVPMTLLCIYLSLVYIAWLNDVPMTLLYNIYLSLVYIAWLRLIKENKDCKAGIVLLEVETYQHTTSSNNGKTDKVPREFSKSKDLVSNSVNIYINC